MNLLHRLSESVKLNRAFNLELRAAGGTFAGAPADTRDTHASGLPSFLY